MATFEDWLDAYHDIYRALPAEPSLPCPNCRRRTLRIVFTGPRGGDIGYASLWCDSCLEGTHICRAVIPPGVAARDIRRAQGQPFPRIPNYRLAT